MLAELLGVAQHRRRDVFAERGGDGDVLPRTAIRRWIRAVSFVPIHPVRRPGSPCVFDMVPMLTAGSRLAVGGSGARLRYRQVSSLIRRTPWRVAISRGA